jgi:hypothetical protein
MFAGLGTLLADEFRFLTFRAPGPGVRERRAAYLAFGLAFAWLAGIGRYWDNPRAGWWQHAGLGSVAYVFVLSGILWGILAPLRPERGSYGSVLLFVAMTSPPAVLYAIPVERFLDAGAAGAANAWFLATVAAWRVALWAVFLRRVARLGRGAATVATLLPLALIVVALAILNLEHVVFSIMGGMGPGSQGANDGAYAVVVLLSLLSFLGSVPLLVAYWVCVAGARDRPRTGRPGS